MHVGENEITNLMIGDMGIKTAAVGNETVYERASGYIYITLDTKEST